MTRQSTRNKGTSSFHIRDTDALVRYPIFSIRGCKEQPSGKDKMRSKIGVEGCLSSDRMNHCWSQSTARHYILIAAPQYKVDRVALTNSLARHLLMRCHKDGE